MSVDRSKFIPLYNYANIFAALEPHAGQHANVYDQKVVHHTGFATRTIDWEVNGKRELMMFSGPTLLGLGPKVAELERLRLLELQSCIKRALQEVDSFLAVVRGP